MSELSELARAIEKATLAADKLLKCAESISNPVYSVSIQGVHGECTILAVRHFQGQINILVKPPFEDIPTPEFRGLSTHEIQKALENPRKEKSR